MKYFLPTILLFLLSACQPSHSNREWQVILKTDQEGSVITGTKEGLINAIRQGADIKIGWGHQGKTRTIEHLSIPIWIGLLDGKEVIARLDPQVGSNIDWENLNSTYEGNEILNEEWRVIISTQGTFDAVWIDRQTSQVNKRVPQRHPITWFVRGYQRTLEFDPLFK